MLSIYRASAGSGKTFTLAYEYIKLLLGSSDPENGTPRLYKGGDRHRSILAITFTNKATDEMKRRIIHELAVLASMEPGWTKKSAYIDNLTEYYKTSRDNIANAAREALLHLLFDFNYFQVSTIDAFFQMILRTFAREAELTGNYEVETDSKYAIKMGVDELLNSVNRDADSADSRRVVKWISDYLLRELDEGRFSNLFDRSNNFYHVFIDFIDQISNETFALHYGEIMDYLADPSRLMRFQAGLYRVIDRRRTDAMMLCERLFAARDAGAAEISYNRYLFPALQKWYSSRGTQAATSTVAKVADNIEAAYTVAGLKQRTKGNYDAGVETLIAEACRAVVDFDSNVKILTETVKNLFVLGLLESVYRYISDYRSETNTLLLSDTNSLLNSIIGEDDTPFVYERVGVWFHNFLIDEFQDTSNLQWENLHPLLSQGLASGHESLIIGDEKQCIYRFRDSDPTLLGEKVGNKFKAFLKDDSDDQGKGNTNWRSSADVVRFNNDLFKRISELAGYEEIYANVVQNISPGHLDHKGYVKICVTTVPKGEDPSEQALEILCNDIDRQLAAGYTPGDIAILARWRSDATKCIDYIERRMKSGQGFCRRFRIISDDAMLLGASPAVRLIISVLKFTENAEIQRVSTSASDSDYKPKGSAALLTNRFEFLSSKGLDASEALVNALSEHDRDLRRTDCEEGEDKCTDSIIPMLPSLKGHASLSSLVDEIVSMYISDAACDEENMYISAFQDVVLDYVQRFGNDLHGFLAWWDSHRRKLTVSAPEDGEAIRVMTIHKSKGLEFKCVHIPFADWDLTSQKGYEWFVPSGLDGYAEIAGEDIPPLLPFKPRGMEGTAYERQYERMMAEQRLDEINVMYVAFTRAVDELCVTSCSVASSSGQKKNCEAGGGLMIPKTTGQLIGILRDKAAVNDDGWIYEVGAPTSPCEDEKSEKTALDPHKEQAMCPYIAYPRRDLWKNTRLDSLPDLKERRPRERGIVLHDVMSKVHQSAELHGVIMRLVRQGRIASSEAQEVEEFLRDAISRIADMGWFDGTRRIMCERDIITGFKDHKIRRPDRVVWTAGGTVDVIDYKFGEERTAEYSAQVRGYMNLLRRLGEKNVRGFIWYLDRNSIVEVQ